MLGNQMNEIMPKVILIGGTSHAGKSTLARQLGEALGWKVIATDRLARHPGRPWKTPPETVPPHVADHYLSLSADELLADVLRHYQTLWPTIRDLIIQRETNLIVEGSALWPERVAPLASPNVTALWLTASDDFLQQRVYTTSGFEGASNHQKEMIQKFVGRTLLYNQRMTEAVRHLNLRSISVEHLSPKELLEQFLIQLKSSKLY